MLQSRLFTKVERTFPKDEEAVNARFLERAGFVYKNSAGIYSYLPLGWRVIQKITAIIREEMNAIGGQEMFMPALVEKRYLDVTGRWNVPVGFKIMRTGEGTGTATISEPDGTKIIEIETGVSSFVLGWTHEEILTAIASKYISSYKDLPFSAYQIQTKFRNEPRAKSGLLRGREFMMKDLYSFHRDEEDLNHFYDLVKEAYLKVFKRVGITAIYTLAAGGDFTSQNTHEFQAICPVGEDTIFVCEKCGYAENKEISQRRKGSACSSCGGAVKEEKAVEVGNIFPLGTKYSEAFNLYYTDEKGKKNFVVMGSYGIGVSRLMATIVEIYHDEAGIIWPEAAAPFRVHLLELGGVSAKSLYEDLQKMNVEVLYDDRQSSAGEKLTDADLIGSPFRLVVSPKTGEKIELKRRNEKESKLVSKSELLEILKTKS